MFAAVFAYYLLEGEGIWPSERIGAVVCSVVGVALCATGLVVTHISTRGIPGGECENVGVSSGLASGTWPLLK